MMRGSWMVAPSKPSTLGLSTGWSRHALEVVAVFAGGQAEIALVVGVRLGGAVEEHDFLLSLVVPGGRIEDGQVFPGVTGMRREDRVAGVAVELHALKLSIYQWAGASLLLTI